MCDDPGPDELPDDESDDHDPEQEAVFEELRRELFGDVPGAEDRSEHAPPTSGERVLYALGQLHRLHMAGRLPVHPSTFSIEDVARIVGVAGQVEFVTENSKETHYHFPTEVLCIEPEQPFPWRLMSLWQWAAEQEHNAFGDEGGD